MRIIERVLEMQQEACSRQREGRSAAPVPTVGFLLAGHLTRAQTVRIRAEAAVAAILAGSMQYGTVRDFGRRSGNSERNTRSVNVPKLNRMFEKARPHENGGRRYTEIILKTMRVAPEGANSTAAGYAAIRRSGAVMGADATEGPPLPAQEYRVQASRIMNDRVLET